MLPCAFRNVCVIHSDIICACSVEETCQSVGNSAFVIVLIEKIIFVKLYFSKDGPFHLHLHFMQVHVCFMVNGSFSVE